MLIWPAHSEFDFVYRAAMGVQWDEGMRCLVAPAPREWSYFDWYCQVVRAVADEYGIQLAVGDATVWTDVPADLRRRIEGSALEG